MMMEYGIDSVILGLAGLIRYSKYSRSLLDCAYRSLTYITALLISFFRGGAFRGLSQIMGNITLTSLGFTEIGLWKKIDSSTIGTDESFENNQLAKQEKVVYAFCDGATNIVQYVGKANNTLKDRMGQYKNATFPSGEKENTNQRVKKRILESNNQISIWGIKPDKMENFSYRGLIIPWYCGLEQALINQFYLNWNKSGNTKIKSPQHSEELMEYIIPEANYKAPDRHYLRCV